MVSVEKIFKRDFFLIPVISICILALISIGAFQFFHQRWIASLSDKVEIQHRQQISEIVHIARNILEPVLVEFRSGKIGRDEALQRIRKIVRQMTYKDQYGNNYVFMSSFDGTMLVQPYEPQKEMTNQWNLRDINGLYIIRELAKAAQTFPDGSFIRYHYYLPNVHNPQEKLAYVIGIPELQCYIGTGMYMQMAINEQREILKRVKHGAIWLIIAILVPLAVSILFILKRNRLLFAEISSRERLEEDLKKSEEKYRSIFENVPQGLYQTAPDGRFLNANKTMAKMYGYETPEEMMKNTYDVGKQYYSIPEMREKFLNIMKEHGHVEKLITEFRRRDGSLFWGSNNSRAVTDDNGSILYYEGSVEDITVLVEAEARARQSEEKFMKVFMTSPEGIGITRLIDGNILDINPGFEAITGWKREEILGRTSSDIGFWDSLSTRQFMFDELKRGGSILYREFQFRRKDGISRTGVYSARTITIHGEECLVFIMHDLTDVRHTEEERHRLEQQLFHSQKMDAIGKLAGGVAHDFNNILTGIQGLVSLLMMNKSTDSVSQGRLAKIEEQIQRGTNLTRQLLNLAYEGKNEKKTVNINELLQTSVQLFMEAKKGIGIDFELDNNISPVEADPGQIEQVLLNLYINADHAMPDGGSIIIHTENIIIEEADTNIFNLKPGNYVKISVTDTGIGMDSLTIKKIFEPFFTTKSEHGGTGLGLASAYGIVRNHGGIINAYSEPGHGSTFNIYLPSSVKNFEVEKTLNADNIYYGSGTIFVVDDEKSVIEATSEMLMMLGYKVLEASSGNEALSIFHEKHGMVDLVILDMIMPVMSGTQVLKALREINPDVKIILSSGYFIQSNTLKTLEYEYNGFMHKPYSIIELSRIVHDALIST